MRKNRGAKAGECLKNIRTNLGLTTRKVAALSRMVAVQQGSREFCLTHARVQQIETEGSMPSLQKLFTLSSIYGMPIEKVFAIYLDPTAAERLRAGMTFPRTHVVTFESSAKKAIPFRTLFDSMSRRGKEALPEVVKAWGEVPTPLIDHLNVSRRRYGFIGLEDYTMYPLIPPGSVVQIVDCTKIAKPARYRTEIERPIYVLQLRTGYICSWCEKKGDRLLSIPHPLSPCGPQTFDVDEAEVIGRVTGVALRFGGDSVAAARTPVDASSKSFAMLTAG